MGVNGNSSYPVERRFRYVPYATCDTFFDLTAGGKKTCFIEPILRLIAGVSGCSGGVRTHVSTIKVPILRHVLFIVLLRHVAENATKFKRQLDIRAARKKHNSLRNDLVQLQRFH